LTNNQQHLQQQQQKQQQRQPQKKYLYNPNPFYYRMNYHQGAHLEKRVPIYDVKPALRRAILKAKQVRVMAPPRPRLSSSPFNRKKKNGKTLPIRRVGGASKLFSTKKKAHNGGGVGGIVWKDKIKQFMFLCAPMSGSPMRCMKIGMRYKDSQQLMNLMMEDSKWTVRLLEVLARDEDVQKEFIKHKLKPLPQDKDQLLILAQDRQRLHPYVVFLASQLTS